MKIGSALSQTCTLDEHIFSAPRHFRRTSSAVQACTEGTKARTGWVSVGKGIRQRPDHNCVPSGWHTRKWPPTILACGHIYIYIYMRIYVYIHMYIRVLFSNGVSHLVACGKQQMCRYVSGGQATTATATTTTATADAPYQCLITLSA